MKSRFKIFHSTWIPELQEILNNWKTWSVETESLFYFEIPLGCMETQQLCLLLDTALHSWEGVRCFCLHGLCWTPFLIKKGILNNMVQSTIPLKDYMCCQLWSIGKSVWNKGFVLDANVQPAGFLYWCCSFLQKLYPGQATGPRVLSVCLVVILILCYQQYMQIRDKHLLLIYLCSLPKSQC